MLLPPRTLIWGACMFLCYGKPRVEFDGGRCHLYYGPHYAGFSYAGGR